MSFLRILLIAFLFYLIIRVTRSLTNKGKAAPPLESAKELVRDELTGVFFDKSKAFTVNSGGQTLYFSSQQNRDVWLAQNRTLQ
ncbi:MAG: hypothetical protein LBI10_02605 [Deltaproteobacteria bacterium]|jgi:hypothetical protein|nr:hypothetical protein [Deltaproteobacteria bacterium]